MTLNKKTIMVFVLTMMLGGSLANAGQVYSWKDSKGVTHYGDQPVYSDEKKIKIDVNKQDDGYASQRAKQRQQMLKAYSQEQKNAATKEEESSSEGSKKKVRCERAKKLQASYKKAAQLYRKDKSGKKVLMDASSKQAAEQEVATYINKWCA